jgi:hypothetical protein
MASRSPTSSVLRQSGENYALRQTCLNSPFGSRALLRNVLKAQLPPL